MIEKMMFMVTILLTGCQTVEAKRMEIGAFAPSSKLKVKDMRGQSIKQASINAMHWGRSCKSLLKLSAKKDETCF